ncbi:dihydroneopterin aldolase [Parasulfitobacter algicola]|uniref:dihydroneopterin aldolase n=1 Tax=Parasulfitobacter algicola TaxID=2614809 RepID=A0ABX2IP91_9RHOB|nr:dihydroneopterin aldolase [Sulfitobacter algicola]NSX54702.1 dihydroneopterin aldolase [Sulfitobacter algicola]
MTQDIHLAFAHPSERSAATSTDDPLDRISVRDHVVDVEIGAFQAERGTTQRVCFNIVVEVTPLTGPIDDDVDRILSYDRITEAVSLELAAERLNLLETLAERVADRILLEPQAMRAFIRIEKLDRGPYALGVEIVRSRALGSVDEVAEVAPHPIIVFLSNTAITSDRLTRWIDELEQTGDPVIFCVGSADQPAPQSKAPAAQRRIDLLAIEQNAWVLAGFDHRCVVVETMTELDWSMKNNQMSVWAPSKIILDAVDGPDTPASDAFALSQWFAHHIHAQKMMIIDTATGPIRSIALMPSEEGRQD